MDEQMATWPATKLAAAIRAGELTSTELLDGYLDRIERLGTDVNAVVTFDVDRARAAAAAADEAHTMGGAGGPLHGLPITIKDAIETEGIRSTGGAKELADHVPQHDAPAVARLKAAGAIVFGKTNCPTWSADVETHNELFGTSSNPWDLGRTTGGSSGGAAAAVAAGFTSFELGTDIGGSVRIPSHCCGVYGLKPTWGVVSQRGYLDHAAGGTIDVDINVFGPIARSADDLDLLLSVLAGPEPDRAVAWHLDLPAAEEHSLADLNIGVWFDEPSAVVESEYRGLLGSVADRLADHGARVSDAHPEVDFGEQYGVFGHLVMEAMTPAMGDGDGGGGIGGSHLDWLRADMRRQELRAVWRSWFERHDLLLCPAMGTAAFPHHQKASIFERMVDVDGAPHSVLELISWLGFIGVLGVPSVCVPIGRTAGNLPVGMQIVAPWYHERRAIRAAQLVEKVIGGYEPPPGF